MDITSDIASTVVSYKRCSEYLLPTVIAWRNVICDQLSRTQRAGAFESGG